MVRVSLPKSRKAKGPGTVRADVAAALWMAACANVCGYTKDEGRVLGLAYARGALHDGFLPGHRPDGDDVMFAGRKLRRVIDGCGELVGFRTAARLVRPVEYLAIREAFGEAAYQAALGAVTDRLWAIRIELLDRTTHAWDLFMRRFAGVRSVAVELVR
jgi:hypothetical protein